MGRGTCAWGFALVALVACGDDSEPAGDSTGVVESSDSTGAPMNTVPVVSAQADISAGCAMAGATRVELHATRVGCIPEFPCTVSDTPRIGDGVDCPGDTSPVELRVELNQTGVYHVEVVTLVGTDELSAACFGEGGVTDVPVDNDRFAASPTIEVELVSDSPCG